MKKKQFYAQMRNIRIKPKPRPLKNEFFFNKHLSQCKVNPLISFDMSIKGILNERQL